MIPTADQFTELFYNCNMQPQPVLQQPGETVVTPNAPPVNDNKLSAYALKQMKA